MFKRFYDSGWQHPGIAFFAAIPLVVAFALRRPFLLGFVAIFGLEILIDALFTGSLAPARGLGLDQPIAIAFVILGDFRYFVVIERIFRGRARELSLPGLGPASVWAVALALAFIVPVASTVPQLALPALFPSDDPFGLHRIFIVYEAMFLALAVAMRAWVLPRRREGVAPELYAWAQRLTLFEIVQYGLWVAADAVILATHADHGYLLRVVPNTLYYALFVPFVWWSAPARLRGGEAVS